jgi:Uma2 family endonuclease
MEVMTETEAARTRPVEYPESDGQPMAESDDHADELRAAVVTLRDHFAARTPDVYVSGNNFLYYVEGDPKQCVSPDCYVVKGVANHRRPIFKVWQEGGHRPCFALELTSRSTRKNDLGDKMSTYRDDLGVAEYFLFDLTRDWVPEGLRGYRLEAGVYQPILPDARGRLSSHELGLDLGIVGEQLRFFEPAAQEPLLRQDERADRAEAAAERAQAVAEHERALAEQARAAAERARAEAVVERERAAKAEAELKRLREELDRLRGR